MDERRTDCKEFFLLKFKSGVSWDVVKKAAEDMNFNVNVALIYS